MIQSIHRRWFAPVALAFSALIVGCASAPLSPVVDYNKSYDFNSVRTVALHHVPQDPEESRAVIPNETRERINLALLRTIEAKGMRVVDDAERADLLLSWHLITEDKVEERQVMTGAMADLMSSPAFVSYYNRAAFYQCWECITPVSRTETHEYRVGTFIVDLIDPEAEKSMWRSVTSTRLRGQFGKDQSRYDDAAEQVLRNFPPQ
jgi:hypothetical protein